MSLRDIFVEAALNALDDAGVDHFDSCTWDAHDQRLFVGQEHLGSLMTDYLGMNPVPGDTRGVRNAPRAARRFRQAFIGSRIGNQRPGSWRAGVDKMTDVSGDEATYACPRLRHGVRGVPGDHVSGPVRADCPRHMAQYGTTRKQLAHVAVKNHRHGAMNPVAQYPFEITVEEVLNSVLVARSSGTSWIARPYADGRRRSSATGNGPQISKTLVKVLASGAGVRHHRTALAKGPDQAGLHRARRRGRLQKAGKTPPTCMCPGARLLHDREIVVLEALDWWNRQGARPRKAA